MRFEAFLRKQKKRWYKIQYLLFSITLIALIYTYYMEEDLRRKICANMFERYFGIYNKYTVNWLPERGGGGKQNKSFSSKLNVSRIHRDVQFTQDGGQVFYAAGGIIRW